MVSGIKVNNVDTVSKYASTAELHTSEIVVFEFGWVAWSFFKLTYLLLFTCQTTYFSLIDEVQ